MPSSIAADMLTEITRHNERVYATFELTLGSDTYRFSDQAVASAGSGMYLKRVVGWDEFERPFADRSFHLVQASGGVQVEDFDNVLGKAIGGPNRGAVLNATAVAYWRSDHVPNADHYQFFSGKVIGWSMPRPRTYHFELGPDDLALANENNNIRRIGPSDWTNLPQRTLDANTPGQVVYGKHRSGGAAGSAGMVPTIPVDEDENLWYLSTGWIIASNIVAVYLNGTEATSDFSVEQVTRSGGLYTCLKHTPDTADQDADTVTVDCDGVDDNGDGVTGNQVDRPLDVITHFLANFVFNAYPEGANQGFQWFTFADAPINDTHFDAAEDFFIDRDYNVSRVLTTDDRGIDVLNDFCASLKVAPFWAYDWKLGILPFDHSVLNLNTGRLVRFEDVPNENVRSEPRIDSLVNHLSVSYLRDHASNSLKRGPVGIIDTNRSPLISESQALNWVQASLV